MSVNKRLNLLSISKGTVNNCNMLHLEKVSEEDEHETLFHLDWKSTPQREIRANYS